MSKVVNVNLGERSYPIHIGSGILPTIGNLAGKISKHGNGLLVSDATVVSLYGDACCAAFPRLGRAIVPAGEASKDGRWLFHLYEKAVEQGLDRTSFVVALGGGVVGDLAGFMAATYLRGIPYIQVPTTLLAMVDSAVGGKTGINLPQGKNLVGAFHQPVLVVADVDTLKTLPPRELVSGLAEVVKYGVIRDAELFALLEKNAQNILKGDAALLEEIIARSCQIKADVVGADERESGLRAILNFGHTLGHAIETVTGYGRYMHGEAIAIGMVFAAQVSCAEKGFPKKDCERLVQLLAALGLPVQAPECNWQALRTVMGVDKKSTAGKPKFVLADRIGSVAFGCEVSEDVLENTCMEMSR
ncbi:MAG: 3-dehydroquinate synthase [bacterium]